MILAGRSNPTETGDAEGTTGTTTADVIETGAATVIETMTVLGNPAKIGVPGSCCRWTVTAMASSIDLKSATTACGKTSNVEPKS